MEFRHLRYFLAVAEELHFARAAERLHIEQSPLSRAIRELEEELGAQLFVRTSRSTRLTLAGKLLMENAPRVLLALDQARENVFTIPTALKIPGCRREKPTRVTSAESGLRRSSRC